MQRSDVSQNSKAERKFSRREMLKWMGVGTAGAVLAGCVPAGAPAGSASSDSDSDASGSDPISVEIWTGFGQGRMADAMTGAIEKFGEENPGFVGNHVIIPWGEIHDKVLAATAAGTPPDAYRGWAWIVADDAAIGGLTPLDDFFAATDTSMDDYWPATRDQMHFEGKLYAMSISTIVQLFYYNKDRIREGGFDADNLPTDLEGWVEIGDALTEVNDAGQIDRVGFIPQIPRFNPVTNWGPAFGVDFWDADTRTVTANNEAGVAMLEWAKSYGEKYKPEEIQSFITSYGGNGFGRNTPEGVYYTGRLAIWVLGSWSYNDLGEYGPDVDFGVTVVPSPASAESGKPASLVANMYFVPQGAKTAEGGFNFAHFMSTSPWVAINKAGPDSVTPSLIANANLPELEEVEPWLPFARDEILPNASAISGMPASGFLNRALGEALDNVLFNDADPATELADAVERTQNEVDKKFKS